MTMWCCHSPHHPCAAKAGAVISAPYHTRYHAPSPLLATPSTRECLYGGRVQLPRHLGGWMDGWFVSQREQLRRISSRDAVVVVVVVVVVVAAAAATTTAGILSSDVERCAMYPYRIRTPLLAQ
ncbi:hypothetical protein LZ31DRAFT_158351 [Colletotrichum somersetense]|nr:hypothetical protein LZ31DRAFT_158351 [Colletotrichum somersetense]